MLSVGQDDVGVIQIARFQQAEDISYPVYLGLTLLLLAMLGEFFLFGDRIACVNCLVPGTPSVP